LQPGLIAFIAQAFDLGRARRAAFDLDTFGPAREVLIFHLAFDFGHVHLRRTEARVCNAARELAVVRHQERTARVIVETAHRCDARGHAAHQVGHCSPSLWIAQRRDDCARLVQHHVHELLRDQPPSVHFDARVPWVGLRAELGHDAPIDADSACRDQLFGTPARSHACTSQYFLKSFFRHENRAWLAHAPGFEQEVQRLRTPT